MRRPRDHQGSGDIADGDIRVSLRDSEGTTLHEETFSSGEITLAEKTGSDGSGSWSPSAVRAGDDVVGDAFSGNYQFHVKC